MLDEATHQELQRILRRAFKNYGGFTLRPVSTNFEEYYQIPELYRDCSSFIESVRRVGNGLADKSLTALYDIQFTTLDGYTFTLGTPPTYDPNRDTTVPNEIYGVRDPSAEERHRQTRKGRKFYLPRQLKHLQRRSLKFWVENDKSLSELRSKYPLLATKPVWGSMSAREALGVILYFYDQKRLRFYDTIIGVDLQEKIKTMAAGHNYQGKWHLIGRLLQLGGSGFLTYQLILEEYPSERSRQSLTRLGREYLERTYLVLNDTPPKEKQRRRGYSDKGSRKLSHQNHEPKTTRLEVEVSNNGELEVTDPRDLMTYYLYGGLMPRRYYKTPGNTDVKTEEIWKELNQERNELRRRKQKEFQEKNGPVIVIQPKQK